MFWNNKEKYIIVLWLFFYTGMVYCKVIIYIYVRVGKINIILSYIVSLKSYKIFLYV